MPTITTSPDVLDKPVEITLSWHEIVDDHAPHRWLREQIIAMFCELKTAATVSRSASAKPAAATRIR